MRQGGARKIGFITYDSCRGQVTNSFNYNTIVGENRVKSLQYEILRAKEILNRFGNAAEVWRKITDKVDEKCGDQI